MATTLANASLTVAISTFMKRTDLDLSSPQENLSLPLSFSVSQDSTVRVWHGKADLDSSGNALDVIDTGDDNSLNINQVMDIVLAIAFNNRSAYTVKVTLPSEFYEASPDPIVLPPGAFFVIAAGTGSGWDVASLSGSGAYLQWDADGSEGEKVVDIVVIGTEGA